MGRELIRQLVAEGCSVAMCDVSDDAMQESRTLALADASPSVTVSTFVADVSDETQLIAFREHVKAAHRTETLNLLFNNAGIGGGGSVVKVKSAEVAKLPAASRESTR